MSARGARWASGATTGVIVLVALVCLLVPLPTVVVDLLLAVNLIGAVLVLLAAASIERPSELRSLPRLLVTASLARLVLSVSTVRLILTQGQAGQVIDGFGKVVVGNDTIVGLAIFVVLALVQYLVLARGGERIAEVAARFALDAMPGQQAALDGDVRSGQLQASEAQRRRGAIVGEAQLFGSLDGAMRFVRGDTIAGFLILGLALVAGLGIGMWRDGLALDVAVRRYTLLTLGDGLVLQLPSLLLASASVLMVTRIAAPDERRASLTSGVFLRPRPLLVAAALSLGVGLVPGLPLWPFVVVAVALVALWYVQRETPTTGSESGRERATLRVRLPRDARADEPTFRAALDTLTTRLHEQTGIDVPTIDLAFVDGLGKSQFVVEVRGFEAARGELKLGAVFVDIAPAALPTGVAGEPASHPRTQHLGAFVAPEDVAKLDAVTSLTAAELVTITTERVLREFLAELCTIESVHQLVTRLTETHPNLVRLVVPERLTMITLADVIRRLVREGISVAHLDEIFDLIASQPDGKLTPIDWVERIRSGQRRQITAQYASGKVVAALLLDADTEELLRDSLRTTDRGAEVALEPDLHDALLHSVADALATQAAPAKIVVTPSDLRRHVRRLLEERYPALPVLAYTELLPDVEIEAVGNLSVRA